MMRIRRSAESKPEPPAPIGFSEAVGQSMAHALVTAGLSPDAAKAAEQHWALIERWNSGANMGIVDMERPDYPKGQDMDEEERDRTEASAGLANEITGAIMALMEDHGWSKEDIQNVVDEAVEAQ